MGGEVKRFEAVDYRDPSKIMEGMEEVDEDGYSKNGHTNGYWKFLEFLFKNKRRYETIKLKCQNRGITASQISVRLDLDRHTVTRYLCEYRDALRRTK